MQVSHAASYVFDRSRLTNVAVFVHNGEVKTLFPAGARFELMCQDFSHRMAGVYNSAATKAMIEEDLEVLR